MRVIRFTLLFTLGVLAGLLLFVGTYQEVSGAGLLRFVYERF